MNDLPLPDSVVIRSPIAAGGLGEELLAHLRNPQGLTAEDADRLMLGAYQLLEREMKRPVREQVIELLWRSLPTAGVSVRHTPCRSVDRVWVVDTEDVATDLTTADYRAHGLGDSANPHSLVEVTPKGDEGFRWPEGYEAGCQPYPFRVQAECGWTEESLPEAIAQAARMIAADWTINKFSADPAMSYHVKHGVREVVMLYGMPNTGVV